MPRADEIALPRWIWLWLPIAIYFGHYFGRAALPEPIYDRLLRHELGLTEQGTVLVLFVALLLGLAAVRWAWRRGDRALVVFFGLFTLGCLYFGGEEASWGQHWFGWGTPADWQTLNNQNETNLHNSNALAGSLLDQLPRNLLGVAILVGGAIMPLWRRARGRTLTPGSRSAWILPGLDCVPAGLIAPLASIPTKVFDELFDGVPWPLDIEAGEVKELMIGVFLLIYIASVIARIRAERAR